MANKEQHPNSQNAHISAAALALGAAVLGSQSPAHYTPYHTDNPAAVSTVIGNATQYSTPEAGISAIGPSDINNLFIAQNELINHDPAAQAIIKTSELKTFPPASVPEHVAKVMDSEAVQIPALGCSGMLIRDEEGAAIGVATADHCFDTSKLRLSSDGKSGTFLTSGSLDAFTGRTEKELSKAGSISEMLMWPAEDANHDLVVAAFDGHSAQEVLARYDHERLSYDEIASLKQGDVIYNSGWPAGQHDFDGVFKRQNFAMTVLGIQDVTVTTGKTIKMLVAAVPKTVDGAECSWGNSGSDAFVLSAEDGPDGSLSVKPRFIGTAAAFNDFGLWYNTKASDAQAEKNFFESSFGVSTDGYAGTCGFAFETPDPAKGAIVVKPADFAQSFDEHVRQIDNYTETFRSKIESSTEHRQIIKGLVHVLTGKNGYWLQDPIMQIDQETQAVYLGYHYHPDGNRADQTDTPSVDYIPFDQLINLQIFSDKGSVKPQISQTVDGKVSKRSSNGYRLKDGTVIGRYLGYDAASGPLLTPNENPYQILVDAGGATIQARQMK